jgi:carbonic anhydrase/acetyltransferase-like protein (isoleucine patch superfamily)
MSLWRLGDVAPRVHSSAFVHPAAQLIGDVTVHEHASVWPGAVLRADFGAIEIGACTSVQDNCVLHPGASEPTWIGPDCVIGHAVHLEGVLIEARVLVGSGAIVLQGSRVRTGAMVAAGALLTTGTEVLAGQRAQGVPARVVENRVDPSWVRDRAEHYRCLARRYLTDLTEIAVGA